MNYVKILDEIAKAYSKLLGDKLVGIYIHGSIAFGCYNPKKSDIDFLVVVKEKPELSEKEEMIQVLLTQTKAAPKKGLEMSVVLEEVCRNFVYPTPFELHFSKMHMDRCLTELKNYCETMNGTDLDLAAHFTVTREVGYALVGQPVSEVFGNVPSSDYLESIKADIANAEEEVDEHPVYVILNLCRVLAYIAEKKVLSKEQGGRWALVHVPNPYTELIRTALQEYLSEDENSWNKTFDRNLAKEFCKYMLRCIYHTVY